MALSTENPTLALQKAGITLDSLGAKGAIRDQFRALKAYLSQIKKNPDLQLVPIADLGADAAVADVACKVYAIFLKKGATATAAFVKGSDHATVASATAPEISIELNAAGQQVFLSYPDGYAQGTGLTIGSDTSADGAVASTAGDGPSGFALIGKA